MKKKLHNIGFLCVGLALSIAACKKDFKDFYPAVNPQYVLPLAKGSITISDYMGNLDTNIKADASTKLYKFVRQEDLDIDFSFDTLVEIPDVNGTAFGYKLDNFVLPDQKPDPVVFKLEDFGINQVNVLDGQTVPVPAFGSTSYQNPPSIDLGDSIDYVTLQTGTVKALIKNDFAFPVTAIIKLKNNVPPTYTGQIGADTITIPAKSSDTARISLVGQTLANKLVIDAAISSSGTSSAVLVKKSDEMTVSMSIVNMAASSGRAKLDVSANKIDRNDTIRIPKIEGGAILKSVLFKAGTLNFEVTKSRSDIPFSLSVTSSSIKDDSKNDLNIGISGKQDDMNGYTFLFETNTKDTNFVVLKTKAEVVLDADGFITFFANDSLRMAPAITGLQFRRLEGYFGTRTITINKTQGLIDSTADFLQKLKLKANSINFDSVDARLIMTTTVGIPVGVDIDIEAKSNFGSSYDVLSNFVKNIPKANENAGNTAPIATDATIVLESDKMAKMISSIPKSLTTKVNMVVNRGVNPSIDAGNFIYDESKVDAKLYLAAPLSIILNALAFADTSAFNPLNGIDDKELANVKDVKGYFLLNLTNGFNIDMDITVSTLNEDSIAVDTLLLPEFGKLKAGHTDANGRVDIPTKSSIKIPLNLDIYRKLKDARNLRIQAVISSGNEGAPTRIYSDSSIGYGLISDIAVKYDKDE